MIKLQCCAKKYDDALRFGEYIGILHNLNPDLCAAWTNAMENVPNIERPGNLLAFSALKSVAALAFLHKNEACYILQSSFEARNLLPCSDRRVDKQEMQGVIQWITRVRYWIVACLIGNKIFVRAVYAKNRRSFTDVTVLECGYRCIYVSLWNIERTRFNRHPGVSGNIFLKPLALQSIIIMRD